MPFHFSNTYAHLPEPFHRPANPTPVAAPELIKLNQELAAELGGEARTEVFAGNLIPDGAEPLAMAYAGHQFGGFSPQLGDGRAILLGEVNGRDIQLKGSGQTPFSRRGDGRSALGPVLREYLVSEAMHALGVPTTRALAAVWSGELVLREEPEPGGIFTRVASSHLRIGTVQYFAARGDSESIRELVRYTNARHYPANETALDLLTSVISRQATLIARWMGLGFIHGVMNTDNMSLSGETIDYGPCAFMDRYHPAKKFSYIDQNGRYAYHNQPGIAQWNLARLAEALLGEIEEADARAAIEIFPKLYEAFRLAIFANKLGLPGKLKWHLAQSLLDLMQEQQADFTLVFRHLSGDPEKLLEQFQDHPPIEKWLSEWEALSPDRDLMRKTNPIYIPRNHRIEEVIAAGKKGDFTLFHELHEVLQSPFEERPQFAKYEETPATEEIVQATFCGT